jgi:DNA-3-methyladenine glycosylase II
MANRTFSIVPKGRFSWEHATAVLGNFCPTRRHAPGTDDLVRLALPLDGDFAPAGVALRWTGDALEGEVFGSDRRHVPVEVAKKQVARIFSLDHDGAGFDALADRDPKLGRVMKALPGLRPVCFTSPYECAAWAIVSQRIAKTQAANVLERFVAEHGPAIEVAGATVRAFPEPKKLARVTRIAGVAAVKVERLREVAAAAMEGKLDAEKLRALGDEDGPASLRAIPGIGPFWSSGIYLRGCGIVDVFPDEPLSVAAAGVLHGLGDRPSSAELERITDRWRPYRMWACFLLRVAAGRGIVAGIREREGAIRRAAVG